MTRDEKGRKDANGGEERPAFPWVWLLPGVAVLIGLTVWGAVVYPRLPDRVPQHMDGSGVDSYADKSVGSVFVPVFVLAGILVVMALVAAAVLRTTPETELRPGERVSSLVNRPSTRAGALRVAKATLFLTFCVGVGLAGACTIMWSTDPEAGGSPGWTLTLTLVPILLGTAALIVAAVRDKRDGRRPPGRPA